ncbi:MAG TPA: hypothetical protein VFV19_16670 [Candidatus Polarisedimenticolaceae bacterium]|nr:hypothetical protein [Candidatus Polarisedimenticolaceae bacterium]
MKLRNVVPVFVAAALASTALNAGVVRMLPKPATTTDLAPTGKGWGEARPDAPPRYPGGHRHSAQYGIYYHGGPIMTGTTAIYYVYYGTWSASQKTILEDFGATIGGSPYFNINTTYWGTNNTPVANSVRLGATTADNYSQGTSLSPASILTIVQTAIDNGSLPMDPNGVYFVIASPDVDMYGFCTAYCGWHNNETVGTTDLKYAFVEDSDRCPSKCAGQQGVSPNGDTGVDGAINIIAHELEESVTDPDGNAWYDGLGRESADKCIWKFGSTYAAPNGSVANMHLGARDYLIQENWTNALGMGCRLAW